MKYHEISESWNIYVYTVIQDVRDTRWWLEFTVPMGTKQIPRLPFAPHLIQGEVWRWTTCATSSPNAWVGSRGKKPTGFDSIGSLKQQKKSTLGGGVEEMHADPQDHRRQGWCEACKVQAVCKSIATSTVQSLIESVRGKDLVETPQGDKQAKASRDSLSALVGECSRVANDKCLTMFEDWNSESTVFANMRCSYLCVYVASCILFKFARWCKQWLFTCIFLPAQISNYSRCKVKHSILNGLASQFPLISTPSNNRMPSFWETISWSHLRIHPGKYIYAQLFAWAVETLNQTLKVGWNLECQTERTGKGKVSQKILDVHDEFVLAQQYQSHQWFCIMSEVVS